jgi:serine/threonine protein kinase/tetratricopeptide (TPR) repeat protein
MMTEESAHSSGPKDQSGTRPSSPPVNPERPVAWKGNGRYRVLRRIGEGGMGVVYEAFDRERGQPVAVKSLLHFTPAALYRFKQEFRTLTDVHHRNLVRLYELVVTEGDAVFFTMELVGGTDFLTYVQKPGASEGAREHSRVMSLPLTRAEAPTMAPVRGAGVGDSSSATMVVPKASPADFDKLRGALRQLVEGVQALHTAGKLHRDIKPSNVLVAPDGRVVILDFGVATELSPVVDENLSEEREVVGTVRYMAPEQAVADVPTPSSDWYSIGVVLYEALTGRPPFSGTAIDVLTMKTVGQPVPPAECVEGVPPDLDSLCRALLDRNPERRPTGPEILRRLGATRSVRPIPSLLPIAEPKASALVGREQQLRALRDAFEGVLSGRSMTVRVAGASGMGKSAVAQHFLDELVERGEAVVLRGRAYERESVPFKAVDSVIDELSRYLNHLEDEGSAVDLPAEIGALARVFPVLRRVPSIGDVAPEEGTDPQLVRRRAFAALRELLGTLTRRQPLVIYVDDVQWGDTDSAALLLELMRPPDAPPLLFVMTQRDNEAQASPFLKEMRDRWPEGAEARDVTVGALDLADAQRLALALLDASDGIAQRTARAAARESRGNPFLIEELVRSNLSVTARPEGATLAVLTLDQMVSQRLERLPDHARLLVEIVAVGGRPLPVPLIARASGIADDQVEEVIALVRTRRLVRAGLRDGREVVETSHDRFRETVVAQLASEKLREHHGRLADALEASPGIDPEAICVHLLGAGRNERAARYAEQAAHEAAAKLAFDQAARLFRLTLDTAPASSEETRRLRTRLAEVLEWSGRSEDAARAYLEAAEGAPPLERGELERAASVGLFASGRIVEGAVVLRRALAAVGMKTPGSALTAVFWLIAYRIRLSLLSLFGLPFEERESDAVPREERARVDAMYAASIGFAFTNVILGTCTAARSLIMALLRAALVEASQYAGMGGKQGRLECKLVDIAGRLAKRDGGRLAEMFFQGNLGISIYLRGEWKKALEMLDAATSGIQTHDLRAGWRTLASVFACWSLNFLGEHRELARRHARLLADAEQLGDMYTSVQLRDGSLAILWLAADDPEGARRNAQEAIALWPRDRYLLQHWHLLYGEGEIELYVGDGAKAYARVERDERALGKSLLLHVQHMRVQTAFLRGRCAIASLDAEPAFRGKRLSETRRLARKLEKEGMVWSAPFAAILRAAAANAEGDRLGAIAGLRSAIDLARAANMSGYVTAARYQLGSLLGDEGRELVVQAEEAMTAQGIRVPARFAATLVPGRWRSPS